MYMLFLKKKNAPKGRTKTNLIWSLSGLYFEVNVATQSVSRSDGGSGPRYDSYSAECQQRPYQLDELQRQIPSEDLVGHQDKTTGTRQVLYSIWPVLQPRIKPCRAGFVWPEENCAWFLPRFSTQSLTPMEFRVFAAAAFGLLIWGRLADWADIIGRELNWIMSSLNQPWTDFNWKNDWKWFTNYFPVWHCKAALTQSVLY